MNEEHIFIGDEYADEPAEPTQVSKKAAVRNRVNGAHYELTFYEEGFLRVRESRKGRRVREHLLELRYLSPNPKSGKRNATAFLWTALGAGVTALASPVILSLLQMSHYAVPATILFATVAAIALMLYVYRSEVAYRFRTASGRAVVMHLSASFGCIRRMRRLVREVSKAITVAKENIEPEDVAYLRAEMKAHYKLAETGVITREACSNGTTQILAKFG